MLPRNDPDRIQITFDDHRLVANAGLLLPATLALHLGLPELVRQRLDLGNALGRANPGDKVMTVVASALAGGDCIDDADVLRTGRTARTLGCVVKAPSTLGTFLRSFRWGQVRQLDRMSRELLARAWSAGAGTGDVLMSRLREGRANTARGAAHFLCEMVGRVRYGEARGQLTVRADRGFYTHAVVSACRETNVRYSITIRQHARLRNLIEAIPEDAWTPIPYWMDGAADVAEATYTPFQSEPDAAPARLVVQRVKPTPGTQLTLFVSYSYHGFITDRDGATLALEADHRRHAEIENAIRNLKYGVGLNHLPSGRFAANPEPAEGGLAGRPGDGAQPRSLDGAPRSGRAGGDHQDPQATLLLPRRTAHPFGAPPHFASAKALALGKPVQWRPGAIASPSISGLTAATSPLTRHPANWTSPPTRADSVREGHFLPTACRIRSAIATAGRHHRANVAALTPPSSPAIGIWLGPFAFPYPSSLVSTTRSLASVDSG